VLEEYLLVRANWRSTVMVFALVPFQSELV